MSDASSGDQYTAARGTPGPSPAPEPPAERVLEAEPVVDATPWWESVCTELAAGRAVDPTRAGLVVQLQAQHFASEAASARHTVEEGWQVEKLLIALESRDRKIADLEQSLKEIKLGTEDPETQHREFVPRASTNPFGLIVGAERAGPRAEPQLRHYSSDSEKAFGYLEDKGGKEFYNFQCLESAAEALWDVIEHLRVCFPQTVAKLNPDASVDATDPAYAAEVELCKAYNTIKAVYDNVINPQLSYLQVEAILHKKYGIPVSD